MISVSFEAEIEIIIAAIRLRANILNEHQKLWDKAKEHERQVANPVAV
ncbi:hypothetical protein IMCC14465_18340 [alpha proteobacterium IMCC14465]|uniref:Uncharacterized protein n=1 Tax=alpha proteobacterium IMCC14465 TaxID=1220535 RepID=J9DXK5_9PROT|nr:hypothetical protein IMCC14465_18340 [alpha proteobacterium IMCC14465]